LTHYRNSFDQAKVGPESSFKFQQKFNPPPLFFEKITV